MGRAAGGCHPRQAAWAMACGCSPWLWAAAGPSPLPRALCSSLGSPVLASAGLGGVSRSPKPTKGVVAAVAGAGDSQKRWRLGGERQTPARCEHGWSRAPCPATPALSDVWPPGRLPLARSASLYHPGIPAGGMGLGGCCEIRRVIPAGPSSLPVPLAPARPPASAELRRGRRRDGSRRLRAVVCRGRPGHAGARSARPCSTAVPSTRPRWRRERPHGQRAPQEEPGRSQARLLLALRPRREAQGR